MKLRQILLLINNIFVYYLPNTFRELYLRVIGKKVIVMNALVNYKYGCFHQCNWGDDLNYHFLGKLCESNISIYGTSWYSQLMHKTNYMCIGSFLHEVTPETIVWGSGVISEDESCYAMKCAPKEVLAVRGKLTRNYLLKRGISCPEVYGDPALLLPLFYPKTNYKKKYKLGIIPNIIDLSNQYVEEQRSNPDVLIILMNHYKNWHEIIDKICECEVIISSSLHGIIISDAYHIPNFWIELSKNVIGNGFKFRDYFSSVGKENVESIKISSSIDIDFYVKNKNIWMEPIFDPNPLLASCPFPSIREAFDSH